MRTRASCWVGDDGSQEGAPLMYVLSVNCSLTCTATRTRPNDNDCNVLAVWAANGFATVAWCNKARQVQARIHCPSWLLISSRRQQGLTNSYVEASDVLSGLHEVPTRRERVQICSPRQQRYSFGPPTRYQTCIFLMSGLRKVIA